MKKKKRQEHTLMCFKWIGQTSRAIWYWKFSYLKLQNHWNFEDKSVIQRSPEALRKIAEAFVKYVTTLTESLGSIT